MLKPAGADSSDGWQALSSKARVIQVPTDLKAVSGLNKRIKAEARRGRRGGLGVIHGTADEGIG